MIPSGGWIAAAAFFLLISAGFGLAMIKYGESLAPPKWLGFGRADIWLIPLALGLALFCALLAR